jgi:hypothetical protein
VFLRLTELQRYSKLQRFSMSVTCKFKEIKTRLSEAGLWLGRLTFYRFVGWLGTPYSTFHWLDTRRCLQLEESSGGRTLRLQVCAPEGTKTRIHNTIKERWFILAPKEWLASFNYLSLVALTLLRFLYLKSVLVLV